MRLPLRALPVAIKVTHLAANACAYAWAALADLHADLVALHEPVTVEHLVPDRTCFECGTSDPTGFCPAHRVLDKGRVN